jgi:hypothetical protein
MTMLPTAPYQTKKGGKMKQDQMIVNKIRDFESRLNTVHVEIMHIKRRLTALEGRLDSLFYPEARVPNDQNKIQHHQE